MLRLHAVLSVYESAYLELAMRSKLPLACKDGLLREAAKRCRVSIVLARPAWAFPVRRSGRR